MLMCLQVFVFLISFVLMTDSWVWLEATPPCCCKTTSPARWRHPHPEYFGLIFVTAAGSGDTSSIFNYNLSVTPWHDVQQSSRHFTHSTTSWPHGGADESVNGISDISSNPWSMNTITSQSIQKNVSFKREDKKSTWSLMSSVNVK